VIVLIFCIFLKIKIVTCQAAVVSRDRDGAIWQ